MSDIFRKRRQQKDAKEKQSNNDAPPQPLVRMKRLTLDLPEPLHRLIKRNAADDGVTMAEKLRALLSEHYRFTG